MDLVRSFSAIRRTLSTDAVTKQINEGIETGPQSPLAGEVAELFCDLTGNERVAYASTGSEAVAGALRLAAP